MYRNKYMLALFGGTRNRIITELKHLVSDDVSISSYQNCDLVVSQIYDTGLPQEPVWDNGIGLLLHGIAFPWGLSLDEFSEDPRPYFRKLINQYRDKLTELPIGFRNGSYAGVIVDNTSSTFYAFTSFLNSIPVYYSLIDDCLIVSTDYYLICLLTHSKLEQLSTGLVEYYTLGTNLSSCTAFDHIKSIPKGAYLRYGDGLICVDFYYRMPAENPSVSFNDYLDEFSYVWDSTIQSVHSDKFKYGLGLTGGIDSRLIISAMHDKRTPLFYTGSHPDHPDYILAKSLTRSLGLSNHILEDYRQSDKLLGYAEYCVMGDNPLNNNSLYYADQMNFRKVNGLVYEFNGLTEFLGGVYHYKDRRSFSNAFIMSLPIKKKVLNDTNYSVQQLISMGLRNKTYFDEVSLLNNPMREALEYVLRQTFGTISSQLGDARYIETFLERFRHVHKMANLLSWAVLGGRRYNEHMSPSMNVELTDLACRIPLEYRDSRRLLLAYLNRYHPETAKLVLSGYIFSAKSPWAVYKILAPHIKVMNHLGIKIPVFQWYIRKNNYQVISKISEVYSFQKAVCMDSEFVESHQIPIRLNEGIADHTKLMRLFNISILEKKIKLGDEGLLLYLKEIIRVIRKANDQT